MMNQSSDKMGRLRVYLAVLALVAAATAKSAKVAKGSAGAGFPGKPMSPWAAYYGAAKASPYAAYAPGQSVYARSLGPPSVPMNTITVPYVPKGSPFFPKFVDPQAMIAKKTDMLSTLFGGLGPVNYPAAGPAKPLLYASEEPAKDTADLQEILGEDPTPKNQKRGIFSAKKMGPKFGGPPPFSPFSKFGPMGPKFGPMGPKFGPMGPKFGPMGPKFGPMGPSFSPVAPNFSPMAPNFGPFGPYGPFSGFSQYPGFNSMAAPVDSSSRRKRSIVGLGPNTPQNLGPPPPYPGLSSIPEEPEAEATVPKQYLPGMFGPFGPFSPFAPVVDPTIYASKKTAFLNSLFSSLATSTPAPPGTFVDPLAPKSTIVPPSFWLPYAVPTEESAGFPAVTELPLPKSTIVPADFWLPSAIIPGPTEYKDKVAVFLGKLFDSLNLNKTVASPASESSEASTKTIVARSVDDFQSINIAKDAIVDSIMTELGSIKTDMLQTLNDMIIAEKTAAFAKPGKPGKPGKPLSPWAAMFAPPTPDPTLPFRQKMATLSQVFDMLTAMQKNITLAIQEASASASEAPIDDFGSRFNATLLDAIQAKLDSFDQSLVSPADSVHPFTGFWGAYPGSFPASGASKRSIGDEEIAGIGDNEKTKRAVRMSMHQGYQSMPPGAVETVEAGGGSVPGHQGGGIKLFIHMPPAGSPSYENESQQNDYEDWGKQWANWAESLKNENERRHHHSRH